MIYQLTDETIREAFAKTGINMKYFPAYEAEVKRRYNSLQEDYPDDEMCLLFEDFEDICENAKKYCYIYHQCIDNGKSENYAHAYADACNRGISEYCWDIQAQAYELAKTQEMNDNTALAFADCCGDVWANGLSLGMKSFMERYNENWQRDFYISMLRAQKYSENEINEILRWS